MGKRPRDRSVARPGQAGSSWDTNGLITRVWFSPMVKDPDGILPKVPSWGKSIRHARYRKPVDTAGLHYCKPPKAKRKRTRKPGQGSVARGPQYENVRAKQEALFEVALARHEFGMAADGTDDKGSVNPKRARELAAGFASVGMGHLIS